MPWIEPIFDRTQADVQEAIRVLSDWKASSYPKLIVDLKGCFNVSDINRIEGDIDFLSRTLNDYGYTVDTFVRTWAHDGLPTAGDVKRIIDNIQLLIDAYYQWPAAPPLPNGMTGYQQINDIEENLKLLMRMIELMVGLFKKSGTFQSGSTVFLPLAR